MDDFERIYQEVMNKVNIAEIDNIRQKEVSDIRKAVIMIVPVTLLGFFLLMKYPLIALIIIPLCFVVFMVFIVFLLFKAQITKKNYDGPARPRKKTFHEEYKNVVIKEFVNTFDPNLNFDSQRSIGPGQYSYGLFESYDVFESNDLVFGKLTDTTSIELGDVHTLEEHETEDDNGHKQTSYSTVFEGLFGIFNLPTSIDSIIKITTDSAFSIIKNSYNVKMDSQEFEKYFDVSSKDKILAMRILTADVMDILINFKKEYSSFEVTINNNFVCVRIPCHNLFEGSRLKSAADKSLLQENYKYLKFICSLSDKLLEAISTKDI